MEQEELFLLDVLKSFVREEKLNFDRELDWPRLLRLAMIHAVDGILGYMAMQSPCPQTEPLLPLLKKKCFASVASNVQRTALADELLTKLDDFGIDHLLFKGYVVRRCFPMPELRMFGDIDLLIRPEDRARCHAMMQELGFEVKTDWEPVYSYCRGQEIYELHTELLETDISEKLDCRSYFRSAWAYAVQTGEHTWELKPEYHFLYLLTHIAKHIHGAGAGIRMYLDLAAFIRHGREETDWAFVAGALDQLGLRTFADYALTLTERYLGTESPIPLQPLSPESFEAFAEFTMAGGIFGTFGRDSGLLTLKNAPDNSRPRFLTVLRRLFPPASQLKPRYTYLQRRPWLLPAAWVHRFFRTRKTWSRHAQEAKSILNTDGFSVEKLKQVYRDLGLG